MVSAKGWFGIMMKRVVKKIFSVFGVEIRSASTSPPERMLLDGLPYPSRTTIPGLSDLERSTLGNFRVHRYNYLNEARWRIILQTGIDFRDQVIFEPGAGIGDQTEWLLSVGAKQVIVSDGRMENISIINKRFAGDSRVSIFLADLEALQPFQGLNIKVDIVFLWGVYYHIFDPAPQFNILDKLSSIAPMIVLDYLESEEDAGFIQEYAYEDPSASISKKSLRPTKAELLEGLQRIYKYVYFPKIQLDIVDPSNISTPRRIIIASHKPLSQHGLDLVNSH